MAIRKGRFLPEEDAVILTSIKNFGIDFRRIIKYLTGRSNAQIRNRYRVLAQNEATKTSMIWTTAEDKKLIQFMANQDPSFNYSSLTCNFPGKDRSHIRTRYMTLRKWMRGHPNTDIAKAPRRSARRLRHGEASKDLNKAIENLKVRLKSEVDHKKSTKITKDSPENAIDKAILKTLFNEHNKDEQMMQKYCDSERSETVNAMGTAVPSNMNTIELILILLGAKLEKGAFKAQYNEKYPKYSELLIENMEQNVVIKTYSKRNPVKLVDATTPSIWGDNPLRKSQYVMPPNYDTITACMRIISHASKPRNNDNVNSTILAKRNVLLQEQLDLLVDRFKVLFLWPLMLSNENPYFRNRPALTAPTVLAGYPGTAIPSSSSVIIEEIDDEIEDTKDIVLTHDFRDEPSCSYKNP